MTRTAPPPAPMRGGLARRWRVIRGVAFCGAAGLLVTALAAPVLAAAPTVHPATNVVLFTPASNDPLAARLEAELGAVGIQVRKSSMPPEDQLDAAVSREIAAGASAVIRVISRSRGADVWTGETTARMLRRTSPDTSDAALSVIALRTVEFLRATLLDVKKQPLEQPREMPTAEHPAETPPRPGGDAAGPVPEVPAPARAAETPPDETRSPGAPPKSELPLEKAPVITKAREAPPGERLHLEITAGPAWLASPGGISPITSPITGVAAIGRGRISGQTGLELMSVFPLAPSNLANPEGTVEVKTALFGAAAVFILATARPFRVDVAVGGAAVMIRAAGQATGGTTPTPTVNSVQTAWKVAAHLRLGGGLDLNQWLSLRADVIGAVVASRTVIGYDVTDSAGKTTSADRGVWGPGFVVATIGLQAAW